MDQAGQVVRVLRLTADRGGQHRWCKNADPVSAEILDEPGYRGEDRSAAIGRAEQRAIASFPPRMSGRRRQRDLCRIRRVAAQQAPGLFRGFVDPPMGEQPVRAFGNEKSAEHNQQGGKDCNGIHQAPSL